MLSKSFVPIINKENKLNNNNDIEDVDYVY